MSIPANVLAAARAAVNGLFDLSGIQVQRLARTPDGYGSATEVWATIATVNGSWAKPTAQVMSQYTERIGSLASWTVRLPLGTPIHNDDRLVMPSGDVLRVQADLSQRSTPVCVRVLATEFR